MKNFEDRLERLETLGEKIRKPDMPLDDAPKPLRRGSNLPAPLKRTLKR